MTYADRPDTSGYPVRPLGCGHSAPIEPSVAAAAQANPARTVWCRQCARLVTIHVLDFEERRRRIRVACSCGHRGKWRDRSGFLLQRELRSDESAHIHAARRADRGADS